MSENKINDTINSAISNPVFDAVNERLKNPFFKIYIFSWLIFNWRSILYVLSTKSIEDKFNYFDKHYNWSEYEIWLSFLVPLLYTFLYRFIWIWINNFIEEKIEKQYKKRYEIQANKKESKLSEDIKIAKKEFDLLQIRNGNKTIEDYELLINGYESNVKILEKENKEIKNEIFILKNQIESVIEVNKNYHEEFELINSDRNTSKMLLKIFERMKRHEEQLSVPDLNFIRDKIPNHNLIEIASAGNGQIGIPTKKGEHFYNVLQIMYPIEI